MDPGLIVFFVALISVSFIAGILVSRRSIAKHDMLLRDGIARMGHTIVEALKETADVPRN